MIKLEELKKELETIDDNLTAEYKENGETDYASQLECQLERIEEAICSLEELELSSIDKIIVSEIEWDEAPAGLPKRVVIEITMDNIDLLEDIDGYSDDLCDYLSEKYGYCIESFNAEIV